MLAGIYQLFQVLRLFFLYARTSFEYKFLFTCLLNFTRFIHSLLRGFCHGEVRENSYSLYLGIIIVVLFIVLHCLIILHCLAFVLLSCSCLMVFLLSYCLSLSYCFALFYF